MSDPTARLNSALEGRYTVEHELGQGGMATVYLAEDLKHSRRVALKVSEGPDSAIFTDYLRADWNEAKGTISPDGERVAYVSDESGIDEVYVRSFPEAQGQIKVSEGGGTDPVWAPDGAAVYFLNDGRVMRASVTTGGFGEPRMLFEGNWAFSVTAPNLLGRAPGWHVIRLRTESRDRGGRHRAWPTHRRTRGRRELVRRAEAAGGQQLIDSPLPARRLHRPDRMAEQVIPSGIGDEARA